MNSLTPELASKVVAADARNQVKAVGEGGTLQAGARQGFLALATKGDPDAMREARETALLQKWLSAGRLSRDEHREIEHILTPMAGASAAAATAGAQSTKGNGYARAADDYGHIGVGRRTFFRWKADGESNAGGPDLPPFDEPQTLEAWYERMRERGVFKHRFPKAIRDAIAVHLRAGPPAGAPAAVDASKPGEAGKSGHTPPGEQAAAGTGPAVPQAFLSGHDGARGLQVEVEAEERRAAALRRARDEAYAQGKMVEGDGHDRRYREVLDTLSLVRQRWLKMAVEEEQLVHVDEVAAVFGPKHQAIVQQGLLLIDDVDEDLAKISDAKERRRLWRSRWEKFCGVLVEGKFAPPLQLEQLCA